MAWKKSLVRAQLAPLCRYIIMSPMSGGDPVSAGSPPDRA